MLAAPEEKRLTEWGRFANLGLTFTGEEGTVVRVFRVLVVPTAALITILGVFGIEDFSKAPYSGIQHHNLVVRGIGRDSPNEGIPLRPGDKILAIDGVVPRNLNHFNFLIYSNRELRPQRYTIARADSVFKLLVRSAPQRQELIYRKLSFFLVACTFILVGLIVVLKRPDIFAALFMVNCFLFSFIITERPVTSVQFLHIAGELVYDCFFIFLPAVFLHFFILFPGTEIKRGTKRSMALRVLYFPPAVLFVSTFLMALYKYTRGIHAGTAPFFNAVTAIYWFLYMLASVIVFVRTYRVSGRVQKIKFRLVIIGLALGIFPISAVMLIKEFRPALDIPYQHVSAVFLAFISISFAYAILKHDAFDLGLVFRKSLVFFVASGLLVAIYYVIFEMLFDRFGAVMGLERSYVAVIAIMLLGITFVPARTVVQRVVDRAFYHSRTVFREEFIDFSRRIHLLLSPDEISRFITTEIHDIFDAEQAHIFLRDQSGYFKLQMSCPEEVRLPLTSFPPNTALMRLMKDKGLPLMMEYFDTIWIKHNLDRISRELLSISAAAVVVPLVDQHELLGFILVGRKVSRGPYTKQESELFELVGERSASSIRNIELYRDSIEKEKLQEELQLAKSIQERLLPASPPHLEDIEIAGRTKPSKEVGGDFYDFVDLADGTIGIAVADVSGKGIPAALLMTTLHAMFRAEAVRGRSSDEILASLSSSLYERSDTTKFATFFYALYDNRGGILRYSNGGSYPPFLIEPSGSFTRLQRGGMLIGLEEHPHYSEGVVKLPPGALVAIYTDGVIDQENEKGENFSEKRLVEFLRNNLHLPLENVIDKLFDTVIAFGANNLKDDMTIVLLRNSNS